MIYRYLVIVWIVQCFSSLCIIVVHSTKQGPKQLQEQQHHVPFLAVREPAKLQSRLLANDEVLAILDQGESYHDQTIEGYSGSGIVIQEIHASLATIWKILVDFDKYPQRIPKVAACEPYTGMGNYIHQHLTLGYRWLSLHVYVQHELQYSPNNNHHNHHHVLLWTLDTMKNSDLEESTGYWYIEDHPTKVGWSRVTYHVHVTLMEWVPSFVWKFMTKQALEEATSWIKKYSEAEERRKTTNNSNKQQQQEQNGYCHGGTSYTSTAGCQVDYFGFESSSRYVPPIGLSRYFLVSSVMGIFLGIVRDGSTIFQHISLLFPLSIRKQRLAKEAVLDHYGMLIRQYMVKGVDPFSPECQSAPGAPCCPARFGALPSSERITSRFPALRTPSRDASTRSTSTKPTSGPPSPQTKKILLGPNALGKRVHISRCSSLVDCLSVSHTLSHPSQQIGIR